MLIKILKELTPIVSDLVKALKDGKVTADERDALILQASLAIAEIVDMVTKDKK